MWELFFENLHEKNYIVWNLTSYKICFHITISWNENEYFYRLKASRSEKNDTPNSTSVVNFLWAVCLIDYNDSRMELSCSLAVRIGSSYTKYSMDLDVWRCISRDVFSTELSCSSSFFPKGTRSLIDTDYNVMLHLMFSLTSHKTLL